MQLSRHNTQDFQQVSQEFCLIDLDKVERQSTFERQSLLQVQSPLALYEDLQKLIQITILTLTDSVEYINEFLRNIKYSQTWTIQENYCMVFKKTHFIRMQQLFMITNIIAKSDDQQFMKTLEDLYTTIKGFQIVPKQNQNLNVEIIQKLLKIELPYLNSFKDLISEVLKLFVKEQFSEVADGVLGLKVIHSKIYTICEIFPSACLFSSDDILNPSQQKTQRWKNLNKLITHRSYGNPEAVHNSFKNLKQQIIWANAAMGTITQVNKLKLYKPEEVVEYVKKGLGLIGLLFLKDDAKKTTQRLQSQPDPKLAKQIINMTDQGITKQMLRMILPQIQFSKQIFIPRLLNYVKLESLANIFNGQHKLEKLIEQKYQIPHTSQYRNKMVQKNPLNIPLRLNCSSELQYKINKSQTIIEKINGLFKKTTIVHSSIVLHIHGGGFISMSSYSHQLYTRKWANQINVPFVSVDYAKAPENPYPSALNDCLEAYLWILYAMEHIYQITPKKIYLVGDSAGGNLVAALTALLIRLNLKAPDGIFLIYPALNIDSKLFTPSLINSLQDFILPHTYLKICAKSYIQEYSPSNDYLLSPILIPESILSKFPITRLYVGDEDPFHDDCLRFTQKLSKTKVDVHLTVYESFGHGFLQFDNKVQPIYEARKAVEQIGKQMKQIINQ